jgi:tetratricopeptide (TPR) repeat protein
MSFPRHIILFFVALLLLTSCGADKYLKQGEKNLALGEYYDAADNFKQAYQKTEPKERKTRGTIARKMAYCYDKSLQTAKAIVAYRNAIRYHEDSMPRITSNLPVC